MTQPTFGTMFSGGGIADCGFIAAGMRGLWAVECEAPIADVYRQNFPDHICLTSKVEDVDWSLLPRVDHGHASPSCRNASRANTDGKECAADITAATAVCRFIDALGPSTFSLENVWAYRNFEAFKMILQTLADKGYYVHYAHLNAADFGGFTPCPIHASYAEHYSVPEIAPDIVDCVATMLPEGQARHLAWSVAASLVKAIRLGNAANATWQQFLGATNQERETATGLAAKLLMTEGTPASESTEDTDGNIGLLLSKCLTESLRSLKLSTISTETRQITVQKILRSILATPCIPNSTTKSDQSRTDGVSGTLGDCPICRFQGVPQTRERLVLRASLKPLPILFPTHAKRADEAHGSLFHDVLLPWVGWYEAIEDLIPTLPESQFADWQLKRLPENIVEDTMLWNMDQTMRPVTQRRTTNPVPTVDTGMMRRPSSIPQAFLLSNAKTEFGDGTRAIDDPSFAVTTQTNGRSRAFLFGDQTSTNGRDVSTRDEAEPSQTITTKHCGRLRALMVHPTDQRTMPVRNGDQPALTVMAGKDRARAFLCDGTTNHFGESMTIRSGDEPAYTVRATTGDTKRPARAFIADGQNAGGHSYTVRTEEEPVNTITAGNKGTHRAFIIDGRNTRTTTDEPATVRQSEDPCFTVTAADGSGRHRASVTDRTPEQMELMDVPHFGRELPWLKNGRVVKMTPRALARFQTIPDIYKLPSKAQLACEIIGNGWPSLMAQRVAENLYPGQTK